MWYLFVFKWVERDSFWDNDGLSPDENTNTPNFDGTHLITAVFIGASHWILSRDNRIIATLPHRIV
jgi:hypothetical protein